MNTGTPLIEEWKPIKGFRGLYEVSNLGRVRSLDRIQYVKNRWGSETRRKRKGQLLVPVLSSSGYHMVHLEPKTIRGKKFHIHHLVLNHFDRERGLNECCNHKDGIKTNNGISNLEWVSYKYNQLHARLNGLSKTNTGKRWSRLSHQQVLEIRKLYGTINTRDIAKKYGVSQMTISRVGLKQTFVNV